MSRAAPWRLWAQALTALVGVTAGAFFLFQRFVAHPSEAEPAPAPVSATAAAGKPAQPAPEAKEEAVILSLSGTVERAGEDGAWQPAAAGDHLRAEDAVRTGAGARAELQVGARARLTVADNAELKVREVSRAVHRFKLFRGRVGVDYQPDGERVLRIEGEGTDAVAQTQNARFSVLASGASLAVATERGSVDLRAKDTTVTVGEGSSSVALAGEAPSAPAPLSAELLLKVARAAGATPVDACAIVEGSASAGSEVQVDGEPVQVDRLGRFRREVARRPGVSSVLVVTRDATGRQREEQIACAPVKKRAAPIENVEIDWSGKATH